jgi:2,4-dienoyl-CoA reductase-like NADH-dependent reductase (Old Yellow Enzyme family)
MPHANRIDLLSPLEFRRGPGMKNRFMLSPLTNLQSHEDGTLSEEEFHWLTLRARGGFGLTMTCAAHVQEVGKGFPGQLGIWSDRHLEGLGRLSTEIRRHGSLAFVQIHHAGMRSPADLIGGTPVCPSDNEKTGARALSLAETEQLASDFVAAAGRAQTAGFDGVEVHGAHGYIIGQYLSGNINHRTDAYGGSLEGRCRLLFEIVRGIRQICRPDFTIGVRLSPERFGMKLSETTVIAQRLMDSGLIDFLDMSLWDVFKEPEEDAFKGRTLLSYFTALNRGDVRLAVAGGIRSPRDAERACDAGADFLALGRAAILHHDFPLRYGENREFSPTELPVSREYLHREGLSDRFVEYMNNWKGFVKNV